MARTVPTTTSESPGILLTAQVWNKFPKGLNDFLSNRPAMVARANTNESITNNTWTVVNFALNLLDTDGGHNTVTNNQMFIAQVTGWYWCRGSISWNTTAPSGRIDTALAKNGSIWVGGSQFLNKGTNVSSAQQASGLVQLNAGDRVELWVRQNTGSTINLDFGFGIEVGMTVLWVHS